MANGSIYFLKNKFWKSWCQPEIKELKNCECVKTIVDESTTRKLNKINFEVPW